jgi:crossover junction endodeoxyribonuclease RuvC
MAAAVRPPGGPTPIPTEMASPVRASASANLRPRPTAAPAGTLRVLGIDPGTVRLGYGVVECGGVGRGDEVRYVECGVLTAPAKATRQARLAEIGGALRELVAELRPNAVAMEEAFFGKNVQSTLALGEARGVAIFIAAEEGLLVSGYAPASVKQSVVGHGRATKDQIGYLVRALLSLRRVPEPDAADALAIAICHARAAFSARARRRP